MAGYDFEFYETGKISVTAGQKAFTGSGTAWKLRGCEGALVVVVGAGTVNFVSSLLTDAAGEFRTAWAGPTLGNASYVMWLPSAVAATALANHQRLAEIIASIQTAQPASEILAGLAALQPANNQLIYATGPKTFNLSPLTPFARSLLDDPDAATMLLTLGLTNASIQSRILDSFGNYAPAGGVNIDNINAGDAGLYNASNTGAPSIPGVGWWWIETQRLYNTNAVRQVATAYYSSSVNEPVIAVRTRSATGLWSAWRYLTGESGSNSNGYYTRSPSGLQVCWGTVALTSSSGGPTANGTWVYPAAFASGSLISSGFRSLSAPATGLRERSYWGNTSIVTQATLAMSVNTSFPAGFSETVECWAFGRWY